MSGKIGSSGTSNPNSYSGNKEQSPNPPLVKSTSQRRSGITHCLRRRNPQLIVADPSLNRPQTERVKGRVKCPPRRTGVGGERGLRQRNPKRGGINTGGMDRTLEAGEPARFLLQVGAEGCRDRLRSSD